MLDFTERARAPNDATLSRELTMPRRALTSPRRQPRQKRAADTVTVLLDATELALARHGFARTTTNLIAKRAGVGIGTLYHYFPSTEALVEAVVHRMWARELGALESRAGLLVDAPLERAIGEMVTALVEVVAARQALYKRWYAEASHLGQLGVGLAMSQRAVEHIEAALLARRAEVRPKDIAFAADFAVKTALAVVRTATRDWPKELASGAVARELTDMLARYLLV